MDTCEGRGPQRAAYTTLRNLSAEKLLAVGERASFLRATPKCGAEAISSCVCVCVSPSFFLREGGGGGGGGGPVIFIFIFIFLIFIYLFIYLGEIVEVDLNPNRTPYKRNNHITILIRIIICVS